MGYVNNTYLICILPSDPRLDARDRKIVKHSPYPQESVCGQLISADLDRKLRLGCWRGKVTSSRKDSVFWGRKAKTACHSLGTHRICKFSNTYKKEEWKQMKWRFMLTEVKLWRAWYFLHDFWAVGQWSKMPFRNITLVVKCEGQTRWGDLEDQTLVKNENEDFDDTKKPDNELSFHWIVNARKFW